MWRSFAWLLAVLSAGCTNLALEQHTVKQVETGADMRYRGAMENLAMFAANPWTLPAMNAIFNGSTKVSDQVQWTSSSVIGRQQVPGGTATYPQSETVNFPEQRQVYGMWTLDPVSSPEKLRAIRACCWRVLYGPDFGAPEDHELLKKYVPGKMPPGHYFDVEADLKDIETNCSGWLCQGCVDQVPARACYKAQCHGRWVWVMPEGMAGLSKFTLIMAKLSRVLTDNYYYPTAQTRTLVFTDQTPRNGMSVNVTAYIDAKGRLTPGDGQYAEPIKHRMEITPQDPTLRAQVTAASAGTASH